MATGSIGIESDMGIRVGNNEFQQFDTKKLGDNW